MKFVVTHALGGFESIVDLDESGTCQIDGMSLRISAGDRPGLYHVSPDGGASIPIILTTDGVGTTSVSIRGYTYNLDVLKEAHHGMLTMLNASPVARTRTIKVTAPMPGLLKVVYFAENAQVRKGDILFTLEAMKMENAIVAPVSGILHSVRTEEGLPVEKGSVLCIVEPV